MVHVNVEVSKVHIISSSVVLSIQLLETDTMQVTVIDTTPMTFCLKKIV